MYIEWFKYNFTRIRGGILTPKQGERGLTHMFANADQFHALSVCQTSVFFIFICGVTWNNWFLLQTFLMKAHSMYQFFWVAPQTKIPKECAVYETGSHQWIDFSFLLFLDWGICPYVCKSAFEDFISSGKQWIKQLVKEMTGPEIKRRMESVRKEMSTMKGVLMASGFQNTASFFLCLSNYQKPGNKEVQMFVIYLWQENFDNCREYMYSDHAAKNILCKKFDDNILL